MRRGLLPSRERARIAVSEGSVLVSGSVADKVARMVDPAEPIEIVALGRAYVSRGGVKLAAALDAFDIDPTGWSCVDVGSSTGGFTDVLLQRGAVGVVAVDVGRGQLDWGLRNDPRVTVLERTDVRAVEPSALEHVDLVVCDVSFISLRTVLRSLATIAAGAPIVALVKPQFEVGRGRVGKGGIVRDPDLHQQAVDGVVAAASALGLNRRGCVASPITGADGNHEFFLLLR